MAWGFVQVNVFDETATSTTIPVTQGSTPTAGNLLVVFVAHDASSSQNSPTVADTLGNTYTEIAAAKKSTAGEVTHTAFYAKNIAGGSANTVTATFSVSSAVRLICVAEYSGLDTASPLDSATANRQSNPGTGTDILTSGNVTIAGTNELLVGFCMNDNRDLPTFTAGTGFAQRLSNHNVYARLLEDITPSATPTAATASITTDGVDKYVTQAVAFKATGAAFVQSAHTRATSSATTTTAALASNVTAGNTICVSAAWANVTDALTSVTDSLGNTYTLLDNPTTVGGLYRAASAYATNILGGACTVTMTLSPGTTSGRTLVVHEVSGVGELDSHAAQAQLAPGTGTDAVSSGSVTTQVPGCYIFAATTDFTGLSTDTQGTGYTSREAFSGGASEDQVQAAAGSVSGTFTSDMGTDSFVTVIQAFQPIADVSPTDVPQLQIIMPRVFVASHTPSWQLL